MASSIAENRRGVEERDAMTGKDFPTKAELLAALRASRDEVLATVRALPPAALEQGRYESGWNGRQILAHLASIEWTYPRLLDIARETAAVTPAPEAETPTRAMRGGNDAYNERQVAKRAHLSTVELLEEFERNRAATIRAVEAAEDALFARTIRSAGGVTGPLALVFHRVAVEHVLGHARDLAGQRGGGGGGGGAPAGGGGAFGG
jgi:uncharacterized damage-inducible protein DinB